MNGDAHADRLGTVVRAILDLRLFAVTVTLLYLPSAANSPVTMVLALFVSIACSLFPLLAWARIQGSVLRHPTWLAVDLALSIAVLALAGPESPFFLATLGTAALAGIVYRAPGAAVFTILLLGGWAAVLVLRPAGADELSMFAAWVTMPALYPLCAAGGAAVRRLLDTQTLTERRLLEAEHATTIASERAWMAREMHDSVGKSLEGIALSASALATRAASGPAHTVEAARELAAAAKVAAGEAREIMSDLRADDVGVGLDEALTAVARSWAQSSKVSLELDVQPVDADGRARYQILAIANEALRNVERHAAAKCVRVSLRLEDECVRLEVADDGRGLPAGHDVAQLVGAGHFGLIGMRERAELLGGSLEVAAPRTARGTTLTAVVPAGDRPRPEPQPKVLERTSLRRLWLWARSLRRRPRRELQEPS